MFNLNIEIVYNDTLGVATMASPNEDIDKKDPSQLLATRYFFSQFWCEFTAEVLKEFLQEDIIYRQQELEKVPANMNFLDKKKEEMKVIEKSAENKSSIYQKDEITKRNFYLQLFRTYCELPFGDTMQSFVKVFNDVFVKEKPQICQKYYLTEVNIVELDLSDKNAHEMNVGFRWNFAEGTSKEMDYLASHYIKTFLMTFLKSIKKQEGEQHMKAFTPRKREEKEASPDPRGKKYHNVKVDTPNNGRELFFSNVLMKVY